MHEQMRTKLKARPFIVVDGIVHQVVVVGRPSALIFFIFF